MKPVLFFITAVSLLTGSCEQTENPEQSFTGKTNTMNPLTDKEQLQQVNALFIRNFITQDHSAHSTIIHPDFVCIESNGTIVDRATYLANWATDYQRSGYNSFQYTEECIRIFNDIALVRSKTIAKRIMNKKEQIAQTIYTDTYKKEQGKWLCIQVQITPVKDPM